jgi:hypothetical protein
MPHLIILLEMWPDAITDWRLSAHIFLRQPFLTFTSLWLKGKPQDQRVQITGNLVPTVINFREMDTFYNDNFYCYGGCGGVYLLFE